MASPVAELSPGIAVSADPGAFDEYFARRRPLLLRGLARSWPAYTNWSFEFFAARAGDAEVCLETGSVLHDETIFHRDRLVAYLERLRDHSGSSADEPAEYLSLFDILAAFPELRADVDFSLLTRRALWSTTFGWLGPAGTLTAYHVDWIDNLLAQIRGRKEVSLVGPDHSDAMYPSDKFDYRTTISCVDPKVPEAWPKFRTVRPAVCVLEPGDVLYIPRGWWHQVRGLEPTISVNTFAHDLVGLLFHQTWVGAERLLHNLGLYRTRSCTCHRRLDDGRRVRR